LAQLLKSKDKLPSVFYHHQVIDDAQCTRKNFLLCMLLTALNHALADYHSASIMSQPPVTPPSLNMTQSPST
jgi:hypothetical protein